MRGNFRLTRLGTHAGFAVVAVAAITLAARLPDPASAPANDPPLPQLPFAVSAVSASSVSTALSSLGQPQAPPPDWHEFYFTRAAYSSGGSFFRRRASWATDYPKADRQFLTVLKRLTNLDAYEGEHAVRLTDPELRRFPFLYGVEVGYMDMSPEEVSSLRSYLDAGGFLVIDDFWGTREWLQFEYQMRLVFPDRQIIDLELDHPVFNTYYEIDEILQVPAYGRFRTYEQDGFVPYAKGIEDDTGRLMVMINWNTDLGDAWEWAEQPDYPLQFSTYAYQMGVNMIVYAMSH